MTTENMAASTVSIFVFVSCISQALSWRCAYYKNIFDQQPQYMDCLIGCCGEAFNRHCCSEAGLIVGVCLAALTILIIAIIIALCMRKKRRREQQEYLRRKYPAASMSITRPAPYVAAPAPAPYYQTKENRRY